MKLRIRENSVRFRLGRSEVQRLADQRVLSEQTDFGRGRKLGYALHAADVPSTAATFDEGTVIVWIPYEAARQLAETDRVGVEARQPLENGAELKILVEKDFECLDAPASEPQDDAFPNPQQCG